jgi:ribonucleoside-diphosphate reductase alpha chain
VNHMKDMGINATKVALARYAAKNPDGTPKENWSAIVERVVNAVVGYEPIEFRQRIRHMIYNRYFLPNTPCLVNAGFENGQLAACFVLPVYDSIDAIMDWTKACALIHKSGGGTGMTFERLRPAGAPVKDGSRGKASGPVSFMGLVDKMTDIVKQGGVRRGANMGIMRVDHPDILRFIHAKNDQSSLLNYNISVTVTDDFMVAVRDQKWYQTQFDGRPWDKPIFDPLTGKDYDHLDGSEPIQGPNTVYHQVSGKLYAPDVWNRIIESAHTYAEPGVIFIDTVNRSNLLAESMGPKLASNPCGEQMLHDNNACNLGSIDIAKFVRDGVFNYKDFTLAVQDAVQFLDCVIDVCTWPTPEIAEVVRRTRPVGLGIMGYADALIKQRIRYGSADAIEFAQSVGRVFRKAAWQASIYLAHVKGPMPEYERNKEAYDRMLWSVGLDRGAPVRNYEVTTIAPTGTISLVAETSSGIEPNFDYAYVRRDTVSERTYAHPLAADELGIIVDWQDPESIAEAANIIVQERGKLPDYFVDAHDVSISDHILTIATWQRYIDNSISKTINAPHDTTLEETRMAHEQAHAFGVKAVSYYRDGSRDNQVLTRGEKKDDDPGLDPVRSNLGVSDMGGAPVRIVRPVELMGSTWQIPIEGHNLYVTVNYNPTDGPQQVLEVFASGPISPSVGFLASKMLRGGFSVEEVARSLSKIRGDHSIWFNKHNFTSPEQVIAECLRLTARKLSGDLVFGESVYEQHPRELVVNPDHKTPFGGGLKPACPDCKSTNFVFLNGCDVCRDCGYSKCK